MKGGCRRVAGGVLLTALVVSCFVWGPFGIIFYVGGLFNSASIFALTLPLALVILLAAAWLLVLVIDAASRWRRLSGHARLRRLLPAAVCCALVTSFTLGFVGVVPPPFDVYMKGFARYARSRTDVPAIQNWLGTLDPNEYVGAMDPGGIPVAPEEHPPAITRLKAMRRPHGVRVGRDDTGALMVRLTWGGGMIGHWGILVGAERMESPPALEMTVYQSLAPGAWVWYDLD